MSDNTTVSPNIQIRQLPLTWMRKLITGIVALDKDKDGVMGREDHMMVADNIVKAGNLSGKASDDIYRLFYDFCDSGENSSQCVTRVPSLAEQLSVLWKQKDNPETIKKWFNIFASLFQALCWDSSGSMTFDNFMIFWNGMGFDKRYARMQFDFLDTNGDGLINQEEFANGFVDYVCNTDENTLNRFHGPLIKY